MKYYIFVNLLCSFLIFSNANAKEDCVHDISNLKCLEYVKVKNADTAIFNIPHLHHLLGKEIKISLLDIKSPSVYSRNKCAKEVAKKARSLIRDIYKNSKNIKAIDVKRDKSFALKGKIIVDDKDIAKILLKKKYAAPVKEFKKIDWCKVKP